MRQTSFPIIVSVSYSFILSFIRYIHTIESLHTRSVSCLRLNCVCAGANLTSAIGLKSVKCHNAFDSLFIVATSSSVNSTAGTLAVSFQRSRIRFAREKSSLPSSLLTHRTSLHHHIASMHMQT